MNALHVRNGIGTCLGSRNYSIAAPCIMVQWTADRKERSEHVDDRKEHKAVRGRRSTQPVSGLPPRVRFAQHFMNN